MRTQTSFETKVVGAFFAAVLVVCGLATSTWIVAKDASEASHWVAHTQEVLNNLAHVRADTLQIELNTQNFRLYGDPAQITERNATIASREATLGRIKELTSDNPGQQERWMRLRQVVNERLAISRRVEQLRRSDGLAAASAYAAKAPLQETRNRMHQLVNDMEHEENRLLADRTRERSRAHQLFLAVDATVALLLIALLTATYVVIRRQLRETEASQRALAENEESLSTTLHSIGDAVLATDTAGRITRMNRVAEELTGWRFDDARGRPIEAVFCVIHEESRVPAEVPVAKVLATGEVQDLANHTALVARNGSERPIADSAAPIRDASGNVSGVVLVFRDETVTRKAQRVIREQNVLLEHRVRERTAQLRESEDHLRSIINNVPALIAFVDADERYVYVNKQYLDVFAPLHSKIAGRSVREILGEERYANVAPRIAAVLQGQPQSYDWQPFPDVWQAISYVPRLDAEERVLGYYVLGTDITERKHAEREIRTLNTDLGRHVRDLEHVSRALRTLSAGNRTMLRATDEQELLGNMCDAIVDTGGYRMACVWYKNQDTPYSLQPMAQSGHRAGLDALHRIRASWADNEYGNGAVARAIRAGETILVRDIQSDPAYSVWRSQLAGYGSCVASPLRIDGEIIGSLAIYAGTADGFSPDEVALLTESADDLAFGIAVLRTRVEQQRYQQAMHRLTFYDALTGLPNQTHFSDALNRAIETSKMDGLRFSVLQTNIERLTEINDALGFHRGDEILREFGARLRMAVPARATVARLRGDEFAVLLPDSDATAAIAMAACVESVLSDPIAIADIALDISAKVGITLFPDHGTTPHDLFRHMDIAVNVAKRRGRGYAVYEPQHSHGQAGRLTMAGELRRAIENGSMHLYLQPKVEIATGRVCGAEGLVRWKHAERGLIPPAEFIGLAEHTGLIRPLTEWLVEAALSLNRAWSRDGEHMPIAINFSARNLHDDNLLQKIRHIRSGLGVGAGALEVEITESMVMADAEHALHVLKDLRDEGIRLYIDDFGTGYSSLSYLQKLPVEYIKIDQSFVSDMLVTRDSSLIVRSTIDLAHDLGRKVVAEGVETRAHWDQLAEFGADIAQGYFIARPMPAEEFRDWLHQFRPPVAALPRTTST
ncbi:MAG TPA: EAL domain-containing protein [Noviherbaspirillum sp.]|uniref:EAL domain-containing protein n=1 Tax=Noviherbaspirillum sp. TaxID=1926288 RepID=UPI002B47E781|nr:EAL domain-containing protein [Noviherbaspirillum sp.]HJV84439.1 EAL domain-containing protein [Noviherbaspirillum sp.]